MALRLTTGRVRLEGKSKFSSINELVGSFPFQSASSTSWVFFLSLNRLAMFEGSFLAVLFFAFFALLWGGFVPISAQFGYRYYREVATKASIEVVFEM
jgi:hypothetical protein